MKKNRLLQSSWIEFARVLEEELKTGTKTLRRPPAKGKTSCVPTSKSNQESLCVKVKDDFSVRAEKGYQETFEGVTAFPKQIQMPLLCDERRPHEEWSTLLLTIFKSLLKINLFFHYDVFSNWQTPRLSAISLRVCRCTISPFNGNWSCIPL